MSESTSILITLLGFLSLLALLVWLSLRHQLATISPAPALRRQPGEPRPLPRFRLRAEDGPLEGRDFELQGSALTIGRDPARCQVLYEGETVSRTHARVQPGPDGPRLVHLSATNKTFVNGEPVEEALLRPGDRVRISRVTFRLERAGSAVFPRL